MVNSITNKVYNNKNNLLSILNKVYKETKEIDKDNFLRMILFGSYARGEETDESDVDVLFVFKNIEDDSYIDRYSDVMWSILYRYGAVIGSIYEEEKYFGWDPIFYNNVEEDGYWYTPEKGLVKIKKGEILSDGY